MARQKHLPTPRPRAQRFGLMLAAALAVQLGGSLFWSAGYAANEFVNWDSLGLTSSQSSEIEEREAEWKRTYATLYPQIQRDKARLRQLLNAPSSDPAEVMELQARIQDNEEKLRSEATRTFLHKKNVLTPNQRVKLQQILFRK
jgi:Spy/CpxP family protein refolding chaperone